MSGHAHHSHSHDDHSGHGHDHDHDHSHDVTPALESTLYSQLDFDGISTLNEEESESGVGIVKKTWAQRLDEEPELKSDADEQLLMYIPFVSSPRSLLLYNSPAFFIPRHVCYQQLINRNLQLHLSNKTPLALNLHIANSLRS